MTNESLNVLWHVLLWAATAAYICASLVYGILAPWERSFTGRCLMFAVTATATVLAIVCFYTLRLTGFPELILVIIYALFFLSGGGLCVAFMRQQLRSRKKASTIKGE